MSDPVRDALTALIRVIDHAESLARVRGGVVLENAREVARRAALGDVSPPPWTPFEACEVYALSDAQVLAIRERFPSLAERDVRAFINELRAHTRTFRNSRYQVAVAEGGGAEVHLSIKRIDQAPIHDWRDLQRIKDELLGPDCEAVELYPARDRLVDLANQFHLWGVRDPEFRFPLGFNDGLVGDESAGGASQRPRGENAP